MNKQYMILVNIKNNSCAIDRGFRGKSSWQAVGNASIARTCETGLVRIGLRYTLTLGDKRRYRIQISKLSTNILLCDITNNAHIVEAKTRNVSCDIEYLLAWL